MFHFNALSIWVLTIFWCRYPSTIQCHLRPDCQWMMKHKSYFFSQQAVFQKAVWKLVLGLMATHFMAMLRKYLENSLEEAIPFKVGQNWKLHQLSYWIKLRAAAVRILPVFRAAAVVEGVFRPYHTKKDPATICLAFSFEWWVVVSVCCQKLNLQCNS